MTEQRIKEICRLVVTFIIVVSSLLIIFAIYNHLQRLAFGSSDDFLFKGSKYIGPVVAAYGIIMIVSITAVLGYGDRMGMIIGYYEKVNIKIVFSIMAIIFIGILICFFYNYGRINGSGIVCQENIFKDKVSYTWDDVENVSVCPAYKVESQSKSRTTYRTVLSYNLNLKDGKTYNLEEYDGFWDKITKVDNFIKNKGIEVKRAKINYRTYVDLMTTYYSTASYDSLERVIRRVIEVDERKIYND